MSKHLTPWEPESFWLRFFRGGRRFRQQADWASFVSPDWRDRIMAAEVTDRFHAKQGRSTGRWILESADRKLSVYLKRHYHLPWWNGLLAALWPTADWSPAFQEWNHLEWAQAQGIPVPRPMAAGEYISPGGKLQSFLAVEELEGMIPLNEAIPAAANLLDPPTFHRWKRGLIVEMARLVRILHQSRHFHKDLYLCHFYIPASFTQYLPGWQNRVYMIDLHRLGYQRLTWPVGQMKDLAQLLYSSGVTGVEARDRLGFWRAYLDSKRPNWFVLLLRWCIQAKWRRYQRHNAKRKSSPQPPAQAA